MKTKPNLSQKIYDIRIPKLGIEGFCDNVTLANYDDFFDNHSNGITILNT